MEEAACLLHNRASGSDWETHRRREYSRCELFRLHGLVVVADDLFTEVPRFEKKVLVALGWTLDVLFSKDLVHFRTTRPLSSLSAAEVKKPV